ncbi:MAG: hypothetical protein ACRD5K_15740 [Candidatus Acidiferrales bacterium]
MNPDDAYWDDLGIAWRAIDSDLERVTPRLQARLRRQSFAIATALVFGIPLAGAGLVLGAFTIWRGWTMSTWNFVTRGIAIILISALLIRALASFLPYRAHADIRTLSEMLDIASARIRRTLFVIRTAIAACAIASVFGVIGAVIRTRAGSPPRLSPIIDLIIVALIVFSLWLYGRRLSAERGKFDYLRRSLGANK